MDYMDPDVCCPQKRLLDITTHSILGGQFIEKKFCFPWMIILAPITFYPPCSVPFESFLVCFIPFDAILLVLFYTLHFFIFDYTLSNQVSCSIKKCRLWHIKWPLSHVRFMAPYIGISPFGVEKIVEFEIWLCFKNTLCCRIRFIIHPGGINRAEYLATPTHNSISLNRFGDRITFYYHCLYCWITKCKKCYACL